MRKKGESPESEFCADDESTECGIIRVFKKMRTRRVKQNEEEGREPGKEIPWQRSVMIGRKL